MTATHRSRANGSITVQLLHVGMLFIGHTKRECVVYSLAGMTHVRVREEFERMFERIGGKG